MKKLVTAVIGLGMGALHLKGAMEFGSEIGAICDTDVERLRKVGEENNIPVEKQTTDYMDIVNNKEINTVIIATPDQLHREMVEKLLDAGKNIMCEKPLALVREDIDAIVRAVEAHPECRFMVGQICRFTPAFIKAKELYDAGRIGELYFVESEYAHDYKHMFDKDPKNWRSDPVRHGVVGGGCHAVDLLRWIVGEDPTEVFAYGTHKLLPDVTYDDATIALLKFPGNIAGKVFVSTGCKRPYTMRTLLYGTKGTLIFDNTSPTMEFYETDENGNTKPVQIVDVKLNNHNAKEEYAAFATALLEDKPIEMSVYEGAKTIAACLAIVESSVSGEKVHPDYNFS